MADRYDAVDDCVEATINRVGHHIILGVPLGLGKPNQLINAFFRRARADTSLKLHIVTALSLEVPEPGSDLERRFLSPFLDRVFGGYEALEYMQALRKGTMPENITVSEFYFKSGSMLNVPYAQQNYISSNYTHVSRDLIDMGVNVLAQLVARQNVDGQEAFSLSCNSDVTLDILPEVARVRAEGRPMVLIGQVHDDLPFMGNRAQVSADQFDFIVQNPAYNTTLFSTPNAPVTTQDFCIGLNASRLIRDGGTLQIGIGALGDAIVYGCQLRHDQNELYRRVLENLGTAGDANALSQRIGGVEPFDKGLYGCSEMFVNGFRHLIQSGIVKRQVVENIPLQRLLNEERLHPTLKREHLEVLQEEGLIGNPLQAKDIEFLQHWGFLGDDATLSGETLEVLDRKVPADLDAPETRDAIAAFCEGRPLKNGIHMHGAFFIGPRDFYQWLREMPKEENRKICMSSVGHVNRLHQNVELEILQRQHARFINAGLKATLSGAFVSDGLSNGQVVSGVGGQYNFVSMAHELPGARSILCLRSTREKNGEVDSNIVFNYGHTTIPRHLRDVVVTEYGCADLRGKTDQDVVKALLRITDSRFQDDLMRQARAAGKLDPYWLLPEEFRDNTPAKLEAALENARRDGFFPGFPLGTDLTDLEIRLGKALKRLKAKSSDRLAMARDVGEALVERGIPDAALPYLERMDLTEPKGMSERLYRKLLVHELRELNLI
ncbi:acetyl-CoA hydrolase/transferase C-terminal domain-containing protein [Marinobacteraceae bacterium S3BR75-40.1]